MKTILLVIFSFYSFSLFCQEKESFSMNQLQKLPIYNGCSGDNSELKKCMNRGVQMHIFRNINSNIFSGEKLDQPIKSFILFSISEEGKVINVRVKSSDAKLRSELERVIKLLPDFEPGKIEGKAVVTRYTLPFTYKGKAN